MKIFFKKLKIRFFWLTLERFPSLFRPSSKPFVSGDTLENFQIIFLMKPKVLIQNL